MTTPDLAETDAVKRPKQAKKPWTILYCDDGYAVTLPDDATAADGLSELLSYHCGVDLPAAALAEHAAEVRVVEWRSTTKAFRESEQLEDEPGFFHEYGDGKRWIRVAWFDGALYDLADQLESEATADV